jgi:hypothetical protein
MHDAERGYLPAILAALRVPVSSQTLVFSKTSLQVDEISREKPRAIYFNDDVYVAWIPGAPMMEIASTDPRYGTVFYTVGQVAADRPTIARVEQPCVSCHGPVRPEVPAPILLMMSVKSDDSGAIIDDFFLTTDRSPIEERWGGWYVSPGATDARHMGRDVPKDVARYPGEGSDAVALMLLAHQAEVHNRIAEAAQAARLQPPAPERVDGAIESLVRSLLFANAAPLPAPLRGNARFVSEFVSRGPRDSRGRSLRDFDLEHRLFRFPLSYLIYSDGFRALPAGMKTRVYSRLRELLSGRDAGPDFAHLSAADRTAILEILTATLSDFAPR